jgi:hypothetical protein
MTPRTALYAPLLALALGACGSGDPTASTPECRRYATELTRAGYSYSCGFGGNVYLCRGYRTTFSWTYGSVQDFVLEARLPTRPRAIEGGSSWVGTWAYMGSGGGRTEFHYDGGGRLLEERSYAHLSLREGDEETRSIEYRSWDSQRRPTSGVLREGDELTPLTLTYSGPYHVEVSNGEATTWDQDGNLLSQTFPSGNTVDYVVTAPGEVCL